MTLSSGLRHLRIETFATLVTMAGVCGAQISTQEIQTLVGGDAKSFGTSLAIDSGFYVVGTVDDSDLKPGNGEATVLIRSGSTWVVDAVLSSPVPEVGSRFGLSTAISGDTIAISAPGASIEGIAFSGSVYIFRRLGTSWVLEQTLQPPVSASEPGGTIGSNGIPLGSAFGRSIALQADTLVVGAWAADPISMDGSTYLRDAGAAYVYERIGTSWSLASTLIAPDANTVANFGSAVDIDLPHIAVGAYNHNVGPLSGVGSVYIFDGLSVAAPDVVPSPQLQAGANFGRSVALEAGKLLVGAQYADAPGHPSAGKAFLFTAEAWALSREFSPDFPQSNSQFGQSVAMRGGTYLIGAPAWTFNEAGESGRAFQFQGDEVSPIAILSNSNLTPGSRFGTSLGLDDGLMLIGAPEPPNESGLVSVHCEQLSASGVEAREGTPPNPSVFSACDSMGPVIGQTWCATIDHTAFFPKAIVDLVVLSAGPANVNESSTFGTLLCDLSSGPGIYVISPGMDFKIQVPADCSLIDAHACLQAASIDSTSAQLTNALDVIVGTY